MLSALNMWYFVDYISESLIVTMLPNRSHDNVDADDVMMKGMGRGSQDISDCFKQSSIACKTPKPFRYGNKN